MDAKLVLDEKYYYLEVQHERIGKMIVGSSDHELSRIVNHQFKLSTKNCDVIKNGYDLDELINKLYTPEGYDQYQYDSGIRKGFELAVELLGDKKFSEEDMLSAYNQGANDGARYESACGDHDSYKQMKEAQDEHVESEKEFIQSLQTNEWDVEICCYVANANDDLDSFNSPLLTNTGIPKLDTDGCLILKRK